jgi:hypothetical protein
MRSFHRASLAALLLVGITGFAEAQTMRRCDVERGTWTFGIVNRFAISTPAGQPCEVSLNPGGTTFLERVSIARRAANGVAGASGNRRFAYAPRAGFRGRDAFRVRLHGENRGQPATGEIEVSVTVR